MPRTWRRGAAPSSTSAASRRGRAQPRSETEELARIGAGRRSPGGVPSRLPLSIDTYKAGVAARAVELGAVMVNDVWGLQKDPAMADAVAAAQAAVVIMHNRTEKDEALDIMSDIRRFFDRSLALAVRAGIPPKRIILDPGIGFGKTARQNIEAIARLGELRDYGRPIMVGVSRKAFLGSLIPAGLQRGQARDRIGTMRDEPRGGGRRRVDLSRARRRRPASHVAALQSRWALPGDWRGGRRTGVHPGTKPEGMFRRDTRWTNRCSPTAPSPRSR